MAPAMPCETSKKCKHGETRGKSNEIKSKLACILEASESTRLRMEGSLPKYHEDHIAGKGDNSLKHYNLVHKFIPVPRAMKIPAANVAVVKEWEKLEKIQAWDLAKVRSKKEVIDGQGDGVPKAGGQQAAADSQGSRTCVCASTLWTGGWHTQGMKDELTSCRGTVKSDRAARKGKWSPRGTENRQAPPIPAQQPAVFRWQ